MKYTIKLLIGLFFIPFLLLGAIYAIIKAFTIITFGLSLDKGNEWSDNIIIKSNDIMQTLKK